MDGAPWNPAGAANGGEALVVHAIGHLDPGNPDHWNRDNKPQVGALEEILGYHISVGERDLAWRAFLARQGGGASSPAV